MEISINSIQPNFEPIVVSLKIEKFDELKALWHIFNVNWNYIKDHSEGPSFERPECPDTFREKRAIWEALDKLYLKSIKSKEVK